MPSIECVEGQVKSHPISGFVHKNDANISKHLLVVSYLRARSEVRASIPFMSGCMSVPDLCKYLPRVSLYLHQAVCTYHDFEDLVRYFSLGDLSPKIVPSNRCGLRTRDGALCYVRLGHRDDLHILDMVRPPVGLDRYVQQQQT